MNIVYEIIGPSSTEAAMAPFSNGRRVLLKISPRLPLDEAGELPSRPIYFEGEMEWLLEAFELATDVLQSLKEISTNQTRIR